MRYVFLFVIAVAACGHAEQIKNKTSDALKFKIESVDDYDVVSVFSNKKLIADITEVSVKDPIIYPYGTKNVAIIITDIIAEDGYYKIAQYVKISSKNGRLSYIYNCKANLARDLKINNNNDDDHQDIYFRKLIWDKKLNMLKVDNENCKPARPITPGGNTF